MAQEAAIQTESRERLIHRCYMTGQQCVYYRNLHSGESTGAFVLSPFTPSFNHLYDRYWSKLCLEGIGIDGTVRRADTVARTGYVMCSRICYPIQQSALIVADVTEPNLNVFYELGLACALGKRVLVLAHESLTRSHVKKFLKGSGLSERTHYYGSTGEPLPDQALARRGPSALFGKCRKNVGGREAFTTLIFSNDQARHLELPPPHRTREAVISENIKQALETLATPGALNRVAKRAKAMLQERGDEKRGAVLDAGDVEKWVGRVRAGIKSFHEAYLGRSAAEEIASADLVVIDTSLNDIETYFWLGACHGLQQRVVPFSATDARVRKIEHPFDIRTLWHVFGELDAQSIGDQLAQIMTELIAAAVSESAVGARSDFWNPLVTSSTIYFYMGTEQASSLASRQVMGEWDVRTFQELSSFASLQNPTLETRVVKPAFRRDTYDWTQAQAYGDLLRRRAGAGHCIVVGTPDVNPVAEMALSILKGIRPFTAHIQIEVDEAKHWRPGAPRFVAEGYVPFKHHLYDYSPPRATSFFIQFDSKSPQRGFLYFARDGGYVGRLCEQYIPREKFEPSDAPKFRKWSLLAHLVVAPNPFAENYPRTSHRIVLLMGVGGPATYALAHMLTGRPPHCYLNPWGEDATREFFAASEKILAGVNELVEAHGAAEAVVRVRVENNIASVNNQYEDSRECVGIELAAPIGGVGNPKPFGFAERTVLLGRDALRGDGAH